MNFASDNWVGAHPAIMDAIMQANNGVMPAYGGDEITARAEARIAEIFGCDPAVFFVMTGGAANGLALSSMTPPYGMIFCHEESHIEMDECAGPGFFTGGAKLTTIPGFAGKLSVNNVRKTFEGFPERPPHGSPPKILSLTQLTECGTAYTIDELRELTDFAHEKNMLVHMDGARFANALVALDVTPAEMSWKAGIDVLCLGATKNGCMAAEAVIFFDKGKAEDFIFRRKRAGHLLSKQRLISAQFNAWFEGGLWLELAEHANEMAKQLSTGLASIVGVEVPYPADGNEVFVVFPDGVAEILRAQGAAFYPWVTPGDPAGGKMQRLICSFATSEHDVEQLIRSVNKVI